MSSDPAYTHQGQQSDYLSLHQQAGYKNATVLATLHISKIRLPHGRRPYKKTMNPKSWKKSVRHSVSTLIAVIAANLAAFLCPVYAQDAEELQGDERLACGAVLCLSSGAGRGQGGCSEYLNKYFSIKFTRPEKTFEARRDFLNICPDAHDFKNNMPALVNAIARGAGNCDAAYLNNLNKAYYEKKIVDKGWNKWSRDDDTVRTERVEYVRNELPAYCKVYEENEYTQGVIPIYIGVEKEDGHFVDPPTQ